MRYKKKKGEFGYTPEVLIPSEGEIRLLGNRHRQCRYYSIGVDICQTQMLRED